MPQLNKMVALEYTIHGFGRRVRSTGFFSLVVQLLICLALTACTSHPPKFSPAPLSRELSKLESRETVTINGQQYDIPEPWKGNRLTAPKFEFSDFSRIPVQYTRNGSKLYILASVQPSLVNLLQAAEKAGILLKVESAYRSKGYQKSIFKRMLAENRTFDDIVRYVAPPGYSQHMLGTAVDFFPSDWHFADTEAYDWLKENAYHFGFKETYTRSNPMKMPWEAWHWNFTGTWEEDTAFSKVRPSGAAKKK